MHWTVIFLIHEQVHPKEGDAVHYLAFGFCYTMLQCTIQTQVFGWQLLGVLACIDFSIYAAGWTPSGAAVLHHQNT